MDALRPARERLKYFVDAGLLEAVPTSWQIVAGTVAMLPVILSETPTQRYTSRRTLLGQIPLRVPLQALYNPAQAVPGSGLLAKRETVVRHVLSVFHPVGSLTYDLQLLQTHPGGLDDLERRARAVVERRGVGAHVLAGLVGGRGYHERVLEEVGMARRFVYPTGEGDPRFTSVVAFARYCLALPTFPDVAHYGFDWDTLRGSARRDGGPRAGGFPDRAAPARPRDYAPPP